ncbi:hypothetical protein BVX99_00920 [bacterium F16]|nr:hypothetical protein BVX99_00920 [bacterium F16]
MTKHRILFVDDDPNLLSGLKRSLFRDFDVVTALGAKEAVGQLKAGKPFAVIVSDMQMPGVDGIQFLRAVHDHWPDSVRVMLTGNADLGTAVAAVNQGHVFRFVTKPCPAEDMRNVLDAAVRQYELIQAEKVLLEKTLTGSISVLVDILSVTNPTAFHRAERIGRYVKQLMDRLGIDSWELSIAAKLSQLGCVTLPESTVYKMLRQERLTREESEMVAKIPETTRGFLRAIPRLEGVAEIIAASVMPREELYAAIQDSKHDNIVTGAQVLKIAESFDAALRQGVPPVSVIANLLKRPEVFDSVIVHALDAISVEGRPANIQEMQVSQLHEGVVLEEDIRGKNDVLLVAKGQEVSDILMLRLHNYCQREKWDKCVKVYVFRGQSE